MSGLKMFIMRGISGSGKTTLAKRIASQKNGSIFTHTDYVKDTERWIENDLNAHFSSQMAVRDALRKSVELVIIDECNLNLYLLSPYVRLAKRYSYEFTVIMPSTSWSQDVDECYRRNVHGINATIIREMKKSLTSLPIQSLNKLLELEPQFDPFECIRNAQLAMEAQNPLVADEMILDYQDWLNLGGFAPIGAKETMINIDNKLKNWRKNHTKPVNWL